MASSQALAVLPMVTSDSKAIAFMKQAYNLSWFSNAVTNAYCVGCVIVAEDDKIISTGFSRELPGNTHAEECALRKIDYSKYASNTLDMYATMEPCSTRLSKNKSCVENIISSGKIRRVFIGGKEPDSLVHCTGTQMLQQAGIEVILVVDTDSKLKLSPNIHILERSSFRIRPFRASDSSTIRKLFEIGMRAEDPERVNKTHQEYVTNSLCGDLADIERSYCSLELRSQGCEFFVAEEVQKGSDELKKESASAVLERHPIVGFVAVSILNKDKTGGTKSSNVAELHRLQVASDFRGRGLGRQLLMTVEAHCLLWSCCKIQLSTITLHKKAIALYLSVGYSESKPSVQNGTVKIIHLEKNL